MHIKKIQLQKFKRFTDLTIDLENQDSGNILPKLVLLIWANGSGKSSIMDAMQSVYDKALKWWNPDKMYSNKWWDCVINIETDQWAIVFWPTNTISWTEQAKKLYTRPSIRIVPEIKGWRDVDDDSVRRSIDFERRFDNDVMKFVNLMIQQMWQAVSGEADGVAKIRNDIILPFNESLKRIFGLEENICLQFQRFQAPSPQNPAKLTFRKWVSEIDFTSLSHGEKQVIIILLNFLMRQEELEDKVIYIDEMDVHLHTSLQYNLIQEIVEHQLPKSSQLWTASHALWFIDYAKSTPDWVILDFDNLNFDESQLLSPVESEMVYDLAVPQSMLHTLFAGKEVILCENKNSLMYAYLNRENTVFVPANNKAWVLNQAKPNELKWIIDRDFLTDDERVSIQASFEIYVLQYYCLENYLYHPDNLEEYYWMVDKSYDKDSYIQWLIHEKNNVKDDILVWKVKNSRDGYMVFKSTHENHVSRWPDTQIAAHLNSDDLEIFMKSFSLKDHWTQLEARQNISQHELMKTQRIQAQLNVIIGE